MICEKCGTFNNDEAAFCTTCGADLKSQAPVAPAQPNPYQSNPYQSNPYQNATPYQNNPYQPQNAKPYGAPPVAPAQPGKGLAIAGMVLGIISLLCFPYITGVLAVIFGAVAKNKGCKSGMATAGIVCGIIGVALWLLMLLACSGTGLMSELMYELM